MPNNTQKYELVSTYHMVKRLVNRCKRAGIYTALDFETTSLNPYNGRVRLVSLCNTKVRAVVDFDRIKGGFHKCAPLFEGHGWIAFHAGFEDGWFEEAGADVQCLDVGHLRRAILGGGRFGLAQMAKWDLDIDMSKDVRLSDWGKKKLSQEQLDYAFFDADVTWQLWRHWASKADEGQRDCLHMLNSMIPAVREMSEAGMKLDVATHQDLVTNWLAVQAERVKRVRKFVDEDEVTNINSDAQWSDYFAARMPDDFLAHWPRTEKTGQLSMANATLKMLAGWVPGTPLEKFFDALSEYKTISKYISSFGQTLITRVELSSDRRIHSNFHIGAAKTCRFSNSDPNVQQIPRDRELIGKATSVRRSFIAGLGRRLVSLDYSGIELRVLALLTGDEQLLQDLIEGDVHAEVATVIAGKKIDKTTPKGKAARQAAKGVSFGIIYGSGAGGLSSTMRCSTIKAQSYIDFWQSRYPKAFQLRYDKMDEVSRTQYIRMVDGGTVYMGRRPDLPKCANYPVQRGALSVMARAIIRHKASMDFERRDGRQKWTRILATIHDALIDEAHTKDSERCLKIMKQDMINGYLDVFPGAPIDRLVEGGIGPNWGELE